MSGGFTFEEWTASTEPPEGWENYDPYEQRCENDVDENGNLTEVCNGKVWSTGGRHHYNGSYQCYTMYLFCENCGHYEVECV